MPPLSSPSVSIGERRALLALARQAILEAVLQGTILGPDPGALNGALSEPGAAFVTLYVRGHLRGCVGQIERDASLAETVAQSAISAALQDPRFAPLSRDEAGNFEIEISVLSPLQPVSPQQIEIGRHGLLIRHGGSRGLLLPQVAVQRRWPPQRFLQETCRKAGLAPNSWQQPGAELFVFTTEVFSEADFPARVYSSST
jgi:AmmeMemoRadiSam system protein A